MKILRIARRILLGLAILNLIAIPVVALYSTATGWDGICYGFTDGSWACPWTEYAANELGLMAIFSIIPLAFFGGLWLLLTFIHVILKKRKENR